MTSVKASNSSLILAVRFRKGNGSSRNRPCGRGKRQGTLEISSPDDHISKHEASGKHQNELQAQNPARFCLKYSPAEHMYEAYQQWRRQAHAYKPPPEPWRQLAVGYQLVCHLLTQRADGERT